LLVGFTHVVEFGNLKYLLEDFVFNFKNIKTTRTSYHYCQLQRKALNGVGFGVFWVSNFPKTKRAGWYFFETFF
jgi:hypothetical protein